MIRRLFGIGSSQSIPYSEDGSIDPESLWISPGSGKSKHLNEAAPSQEQQAESGLQDVNSFEETGWFGLDGSDDPHERTLLALDPRLLDQPSSPPAAKPKPRKRKRKSEDSTRADPPKDQEIVPTSSLGDAEASVAPIDGESPRLAAHRKRLEEWEQRRKNRAAATGRAQTNTKRKLSFSEPNEDVRGQKRQQTGVQDTSGDEDRPVDTHSSSELARLGLDEIDAQTHLNSSSLNGTGPESQDSAAPADKSDPVAPEGTIRKDDIPRSKKPRVAAKKSNSFAHEEVVATGSEEEGELRSFGPLTDAEFRVLDRYRDQYANEHGLTHPEFNDLIQATGGRNNEARQFWGTIYALLPKRNEASVRKACRRRYHNYDVRGKWTPQDDADLRAAYDWKPGKWKAIGSRIGRMAEDCRDRWRNYLQSSNVKKGEQWTEQDELDLSFAVNELADKIRRAEMSKAESEGYHFSEQDWQSMVNFQLVSEQLDAKRTRLQCYQHWREMQNREPKPATPRKDSTDSKSNWRRIAAMKKYKQMTTEDKIEILTLIHNSGTFSEERIPWINFAKEDRDSQWSTTDRKMALEQMKLLVPPQETLRDTLQALFEHFGHPLPSRTPAGLSRTPTNVSKQPTDHQLSRKAAADTNAVAGKSKEVSTASVNVSSGRDSRDASSTSDSAQSASPTPRRAGQYESKTGNKAGVEAQDREDSESAQEEASSPVKPRGPPSLMDVDDDEDANSSSSEEADGTPTTRKAARDAVDASESSSSSPSSRSSSSSGSSSKKQSQRARAKATEATSDSSDVDDDSSNASESDASSSIDPNRVRVAGRSQSISSQSERTERKPAVYVEGTPDSDGNSDSAESDGDAEADDAESTSSKASSKRSSSASVAGPSRKAKRNASDDSSDNSESSSGGSGDESKPRARAQSSSPSSSGDGGETAKAAKTTRRRSGSDDEEDDNDSSSEESSDSDSS